MSRAPTILIRCLPDRSLVRRSSPGLRSKRARLSVSPWSWTHPGRTSAIIAIGTNSSRRPILATIPVTGGCACSPWRAMTSSTRPIRSPSLPSSGLWTMPERWMMSAAIRLRTSAIGTRRSARLHSSEDFTGLGRVSRGRLAPAALLIAVVQGRLDGHARASSGRAAANRGPRSQGNPVVGGQGVARVTSRASSPRRSLGHGVLGPSVPGARRRGGAGEGGEPRPLPQAIRSACPNCASSTSPVDVLEYVVMCTAGFPEPLTFSRRARRPSPAAWGTSISSTTINASARGYSA